MSVVVFSYELCATYPGKLGDQSRIKSPPSFGQFVSGNIVTLDMAATRGFSSGVVNVLVSFYRNGEDFAFERHRSSVTFGLASQSNVVAIKKHLTEFLGSKACDEIWNGGL